MKLSELNLKIKPPTHYVEGGFVAFSTIEQELYYETVRVVKGQEHSYLCSGKVVSKKMLDNIRNAKKLQEVIYA